MTWKPVHSWAAVTEAIRESGGNINAARKALGYSSTCTLWGRIKRNPSIWPAEIEYPAKGPRPKYDGVITEALRIAGGSVVRASQISGVGYATIHIAIKSRPHIWPVGVARPARSER
ncbi:hypothetical protein SuUB7_20710 [Streptococcus uberis]